MSKPVAEGKAAICLGGDGIVYLTYRDGTSLDDTDARGIMAAVNAACLDRRRPLLVDLTGVESVSRGARWVFSVRSRVSRVALFGPRPVERVIAIFFTRMHAMPCPTAVFNRLAPAVQWLHAVERDQEEGPAGK